MFLSYNAATTLVSFSFFCIPPIQPNKPTDILSLFVSLSHEIALLESDECCRYFDKYCIMQVPSHMSFFSVKMASILAVHAMDSVRRRMRFIFRGMYICHQSLFMISKIISSRCFFLSFSFLLSNFIHQKNGWQAYVMSTWYADPSLIYLLMQTMQHHVGVQT